MTDDLQEFKIGDPGPYDIKTFPVVHPIIKHFKEGEIDAALIKTFYECVNAVNSKPVVKTIPEYVYTADNGELLLLFVWGKKNEANEWEVLFRFGVSRNETNLTVGKVTDIAKGGWDQLIVAEEDRVLVQEIYSKADFAALKLFRCPAAMKKKIIQSRNAYAVNGVTATLTITSRAGVLHVFQIDTSLLDHVQRYCWRVERGTPVTDICDRMGNDCHVAQLPRYLLALTSDDKCKVKAINGDKNDLRLANLRIGKRPKKPDETRRNKTGFTGVFFFPNRKEKWLRYAAYTAGKPRFLGLFSTADDANEARDNWIKENKWTPKKRGRRAGWQKENAEPMNALPNEVLFFAARHFPQPDIANEPAEELPFDIKDGEANGLKDGKIAITCWT